METNFGKAQVLLIANKDIKRLSVTLVEVWYGNGIECSVEVYYGSFQLFKRYEHMHLNVSVGNLESAWPICKMHVCAFTHNIGNNRHMHTHLHSHTCSCSSYMDMKLPRVCESKRHWIHMAVSNITFTRAAAAAL